MFCGSAAGQCWLDRNRCRGEDDVCQGHMVCKKMRYDAGGLSEMS